MTRRSLLFVCAALVIIVIGVAASPVAFGQATTSSGELCAWDPGLFDCADPTSLGSFSLLRNDNGISMTIDTIGLPPGHAVTVWWIIFDPSGFLGVWATGHVVDDSGAASFGAHIKKGATGLFGAGMLTDPRNAFVFPLIRDHGPTIPGLVNEQISTFNGGCPPNTCADIQGPILF